MDAITEGFSILVVGMSGVFLFLGIMVIGMKVLQLFVGWLEIRFPQAIAVQPKGSNQDNNPKLAAAIAAAYHNHISTKGRN